MKDKKYTIAFLTMIGIAVIATIYTILKISE
jgi:hypothetical protein